jgi:glycosyltransferase involved in cell wall biosynthesis
MHLNRYFYTGQTRQVFSLIQEQQRLGHKSLLVMDGFSSHRSLEIFKKTQGNLGAVLIKGSDSELICQEVKKYRFDLIHAHSPLIFPPAASLSTELKIPFVVTCHGFVLNPQEYSSYFQKAEAMLCNSQRVAGSLRKFAHKVYLISSGVDLDEFKPGEKSEPVKILLVSRISTKKLNGYSQFCKAVDLLEGVEFYVISDKKPNSVKANYLGWINQTAELLAHTDIVVGTGRAIIEGLASGNAAMILGRTYQGILSPNYSKKHKELDLSGLSGTKPCYKNIFFDLAKLTQNQIYLQKLQVFGRQLAKEKFDNRLIAEHILTIYKKVLQ